MGTHVPAWELASQKATLRPEMGTHVPNRELTARNGNLRPSSGDFASNRSGFPAAGGVMARNHPTGAVDSHQAWRVGWPLLICCSLLSATVMS